MTQKEIKTIAELIAHCTTLPDTMVEQDAVRQARKQIIFALAEHFEDKIKSEDFVRLCNRHSY